MIRQEGTTSQPWDGAGSAPSHLSRGDSGSGNSKKSKIKKKKKGEKKALESVCGNSQGPEAVYFRT